MENILLLDTSVASFNKGDDIIMECTRKELAPILEHNFELTLPTHVSPFHWYQVLRNSIAYRTYSDCELKFVGGSNILNPICNYIIKVMRVWRICTDIIIGESC